MRKFTKTVKFVNTRKAISTSLTKTEDKQSVDVGATVNYTIYGNAPDTTLFQNYSYIITDEMDDGLTFNKDVKVTINGKDVTGECTIGYDVGGNANKFTVSVPNKRNNLRIDHPTIRLFCCVSI